MDIVDTPRIIFALIFVLALIGAAGLLARRLGYGGATAAAGRRRRLALVETLPLDPRRRAAILRCDGREHLIILGPTGETVVAADLADSEQTEEEPPSIAGASFGDAFRRLGANPWRGRSSARLADSERKEPRIGAEHGERREERDQDARSNETESHGTRDIGDSDGDFGRNVVRRVS